MSSEYIIQLKNISKTYEIYKNPIDRLRQMFAPGGTKHCKKVFALNNIELSVKHGETIGIVGHNGSGKSTLLQVLCGTLTPTTGDLVVNGRMAVMLELGAGFNLDFTGRENVYTSGILLGLSTKEIESRFDKILTFTDIGEFIDQPVKTYSSGMFARLAFAISINVDADILVIDEILSVGDEAFQRKCFSRIQQLRESGTTILFVSHSAGNIIELCDRAILLDHGEQVLTGKPKDVIARYHKLLYAPPESRMAIIQEISDEKFKSDQASTDIDQNVAVEAENILEADNVARFDPDLISSSMLCHESNGALISDVKILNDDEPVNILCSGATYTFAYEVQFTKAAYHVHFGMLIKSVTGVDLGAMSSHSTGEGIAFIDEGETVKIRFRFLNSFLHGTYFVNAGCSGIVNGNVAFLHRISDVVMFKVEPVANARAQGGYVRIATEPACSIQNSDGEFFQVGSQRS